MADLTILYITASEVPETFAQFQRDTLLKAAGDYPIISVSRLPLFFGKANLVDNKPKSQSNIYYQMLQAARVADTEFVAIAEDDVLYHKDHFNFFRPDWTTFAYNQNRFALFTWGEPIYSFRNRKSNASLIAPRKLLIEALEERFEKWPNGTPEELTGELGRPMVERNLGLIRRKAVEVYGEVSLIQFNHEHASDPRQLDKRKKLGQIKAYDLYYWGKASDLVKNYG